jgi:hypothetical protein
MLISSRLYASRDTLRRYDSNAARLLVHLDVIAIISLILGPDFIHKQYLYSHSQPASRLIGRDIYNFATITEYCAFWRLLASCRRVTPRRFLARRRVLCDEMIYSRVSLISLMCL